MEFVVQVVEKLVDIVTFLHLEIIKAFGNKGKGLFFPVENVKTLENSS